jgi:ADP-heptose:LPS heptosyltransferase
MRAIQKIQNYFSEDNESFLTGLYKELFNREPDIDGFKYHIRNLNDGFSRIDVFKEIVSSKEFGILISEAKIIQTLQKTFLKNDYEFIKQLYLVIFGESPKLSQLQNDKEKLRKNSISKIGLIQTLLLNEEIIIQLTQTNPLKFTKSSIIKTLHRIFHLESPEFHKELIREMYDCHSKQIDLMKNPQFLEKGLTKSDIYTSLINSPEFTTQFNNNSSSNCIKILQRLMKLNDEEFIFEVYQECLGREPDSNGFRWYMNYINLGIERIDILREILLSNEACERFIQQIEIINKPVENLCTLPSPSSKLRNYVENTLTNHNLPYKTNIIFKIGGLGDFIQLTPVAKALKTKNPEYPVVAVIGGLFGSYANIFEEHPFIDLAIDVAHIEDRNNVQSLEGLVENVFDIRYVSRSFGEIKSAKFSYENEWYYHNSPDSGSRLDDLNMHVCDLMLHSLGLEQYADCNDVCIIPDKVPEEIPGDYVVVCNNVGTSFGGPLKEWGAEEWGELIKWLNLKGIIPVQLGGLSDKLMHSGVMDLRGLTTPRQAAGYLKLSRGYIGVEGGLFHLSKSVGTPAVVIFASTSPICFAYPDTRVVTKNTCRPCWWNGPWIHGTCIRGSNSCLNLPDWKSVSIEVEKMISERRVE